MHRKIFHGWYIVGACVLITLYTMGIVHFGFTAVFEPIAEECGWSYAQISVAASLRGLEIGLLAPLMGFLVDRWGPRILIFCGSILVCLGLLFLSRVSSLITFYGAFGLIAIGVSTCTGTVLMTAVTNWFHKKASIAIGIVASGFGLGGLMVPVVTKLIDILQWRMAMVAVGLGMLVIVLPLSFLVRHKPEKYGYQPDGEVSGEAEIMQNPVSTANAEVNISYKQALRKRAFWHIAISATCYTFVTGAVVTHVMPYLSSISINRSVSSIVALVIPVASIGGRLSSGWLVNRFGSKKIFASSFALVAAGLLLYEYVNSEEIWLLVPFLITYSLGWGFSVTTRFSLIREYFGRVNFGTIIGFLSGIMMLGNIAGTPLVGWVFDTWGSYQGAWLGCGAISLIGAVLAFTIPSPGITER